MSHVNDSQTLNIVNVNITTEQQYQGVLEKLLFSSVTGIPCCVFLFINGTMLFTLRSKPVFCDTCRYVLLYNLLFADTAQMACGQLLYTLAVCGIILTYPMCAVFTMFASLTNDISPLTLVAMSLERYVAVCHPLRHATMITIRSTGVAVCVVWAISLLNVVTRVLFLVKFASENLHSLQMSDPCSGLAMMVDPLTNQYNNLYTYFLFISATVAITSSYIGVMVAARLASTNKASARKAHSTLLLHLVQLAFTLSSTMHSSVIQSISKIFQRLVAVRLRTVLYVFNYILPRCLSSLIYGLRDPTIRPVLIYHLCCQMKLCHRNESRITARTKY
ncbi:odorant receptor 131-2-like [Anabas testudineus]|uniref:odorant receptor 131-2-like n=1 Tax=Anabas testudineus TaxID=64144 RepID=UPI000E454DDB|nr:odorant receptor 131-2-like [Anabas testudineus]